MKIKETGKAKFFCECFFEKCMEWTEFLRYGLVRRDTWTSHLVEHYRIHQEYIGKDYVKEFLEERKKTIGGNNYRMVVETINEEHDKDTVGIVELFRKNKFIHRATLKVKESDEDSPHRLIFWSFENSKENNPQKQKP